MRKTSIGIVLAGLLAACSCGAAESPRARTIVTTFFPIQVAVLNLVAGLEGINVVNLAAPSSGCLHDYQLTARDMAVLATAEVVVANGAGMESFLGTIATRRPGVVMIDASAGLDLLCEGGHTNAHVWVSPVRHIRQVRAIAGKLALWDPRHGRDYYLNADRYVAKLEALNQEMGDALRDGRGREIITFHEAFAYFADDFGLKVVAVVEREPGSAPSSGELAALIRLIKSSGVRALFVEPQYPAKPAETIARATGIRLYTLDPVVSGTPEVNAYLRAMRLNRDELRRALAPASMR